MEQELYYPPPRKLHMKTKSLSKSKGTNVNNNVISVSVTVKNNKTKILETEPSTNKFTLPVLTRQKTPKNNKKSLNNPTKYPHKNFQEVNYLNTSKGFSQYNNSGRKTSQIKKFMKKIPMLKIKTLQTLSKSTTLKTKKYNVQCKKVLKNQLKPNPLDNTLKMSDGMGKIDILYEFEKKTLLIQKNVRRLLSKRKMEQLKVTKLIKGEMTFNDKNEVYDFINDNYSNEKPLVLKQLTFKKDNSNSSGNSENSSEKNKKSKISLAKNKSANLLNIGHVGSLNDSMNSLRSGVSQVSIRSNEINFLDEEEEEDEEDFF